MNPQAYYDYMHGMPVNEVWARYQQYPWWNNNGSIVMQQDAPIVKGPMLPPNTQATSLPENVFAATQLQAPFKRVPTGKVFVNKLYDRGTQLAFANHELQHLNQLKSNLPTGDVQHTSAQATNEYLSNLGEKQARMVGHRSAYPSEWLPMVHPYNNSYEDKIADASVSYPELIKLLATVAPEQRKEITDTVQLKSEINKHKRDVNMGETMQNSFKGINIKPAINLLDLLQTYYPPFISSGLQGN